MDENPVPRNPAHGLPLHQFPYAWASDWGEDEFGIWVAFTYKKVRHAFRWIPPGTFLMGSPEVEVERFERELQHSVTLTKGFWLGETPVTQALWQALMGGNPSRFKDPEHPVENVSWEDARLLIQKFNGLKPGLGLRLPTEAEWEYACRAGAATPFYCGNQITPGRVNYNGNFPYAGGEKGVYRQKTVAVYEFPANPWGLFQMYGNVREWCSDWYDAYEEGAAIDPVGPESGESRLLRGGSWIARAGRCRSADRDFAIPVFRGFYVGSRLAMDHPAL